MIQAIADISESRLHTLQQVVKWTVYTLLLINWGFYIQEDWERAGHTLTASSTIVDWASSYATSIDESAWFILLFMFELETYILDDREWSSWVSKTIHGVRAVCVLMILHTVYAYTVTLIEYQPTQPVQDAASLCELADDNVSFVYNLEYTEVTTETCSRLSDATQFYKLGKDPVVTTREGLELERDLAWSDVIEVVSWVFIILSIELVVRMQDHGVTSSRAITAATRLKMFLYLVLAGLAVYWATLSHWLYTWDTFVWIAGFAAIEMNISEWRDEILEKSAATA